MAKKPQKKIHVSEETRKGLERYYLIYGYIKESLTDRNRKHDRQTILKKYHKLKDKCKDVPASGLSYCVEGQLQRKKVLEQAREHERESLAPEVEQKTGRKIPKALIVFDWHRFYEIFTRSKNKFNPEDNIVIDANFLGIGEFEFKVKDFPLAYKRPYKTMRAKMTSLIKKKIIKKSPVPQFQIVEETKDTFKWSMEGESKLPTGTEAAEPVIPEDEKESIGENKIDKEKKIISEQKELEIEKQKTVQQQIKLEEVKEKTSIAQANESRERQKEIKQLENLYSKGLITKSQFRKRFNKLSK